MNDPKAASQCMAGPAPKVRDNAAQAGASDARPIPGTPLASPPSYLKVGWPPGPFHRLVYSVQGKENWSSFSATVLILRNVL